MPSTCASVRSEQPSTATFGWRSHCSSGRWRFSPASVEAVDYWFNLANLLSDRGRRDEAIAAYERSVERLHQFERIPETLARVEPTRIRLNLGAALKARSRGMVSSRWPPSQTSTTSACTRASTS